MIEQYVTSKNRAGRAAHQNNNKWKDKKMSKYHKNDKKVPSFLYVMVGMSIMFVIFRTMFWSEFNIEMDTLSIFVPAFTIGCLTVYWIM